jgi:hypothetical protein
MTCIQCIYPELRLFLGEHSANSIISRRLPLFHALRCRRLEDIAFIEAQLCFLMFAYGAGLFLVDVLGNLSKIHEPGTCDAGSELCCRSVHVRSRGGSVGVPYNTLNLVFELWSFTSPVAYHKVYYCLL